MRTTSSLILFLATIASARVVPGWFQPGALTEAIVVERNLENKTIIRDVKFRAEGNERYLDDAKIIRSMNAGPGKVAALVVRAHQV